MRFTALKHTCCANRFFFYHYLFIRFFSTNMWSIEAHLLREQVLYYLNAYFLSVIIYLLIFWTEAHNCCANRSSIRKQGIRSTHVWSWSFFLIFFLVVAGHLSEEGFGRRHGQRHNGLYVTALSACIHGTASLLHSTAFNACIQGTSLLHSTSWSKTQRTIYYCLLCMYTFSKVLYLGTLHNQLNRDFNFLKSPLYRDKKIYKQNTQSSI
jgi:hypothetical protein